METNSKLATAREELGLTQQELARMAGLAQSTIARLESGESSPSADTAQRVSRCLGKTVEELFAPETVECDLFVLRIAEARYSAKQALLARDEVQWRERNGVPERELKWLRKAEKSHVEALTHQLLSLPEAARPAALKKLCAQVWTQ